MEPDAALEPTHVDAVRKQEHETDGAAKVLR